MKTVIWTLAVVVGVVLTDILAARGVQQRPL